MRPLTLLTRKRDMLGDPLILLGLMLLPPIADILELSLAADLPLTPLNMSLPAIGLTMPADPNLIPDLVGMCLPLILCILRSMPLSKELI